MFICKNLEDAASKVIQLTDAPGEVYILAVADPSAKIGELLDMVSNHYD